MNKFIKIFNCSLGVFMFGIGLVFLEKVLDKYPESTPSPLLFIIMFIGLVVFFYNRD